MLFSVEEPPNKFYTRIRVIPWCSVHSRVDLVGPSEKWGIIIFMLCRQRTPN